MENLEIRGKVTGVDLILVDDSKQKCRQRFALRRDFEFAGSGGLEADAGEKVCWLDVQGPGQFDQRVQAGKLVPA